MTYLQLKKKKKKKKKSLLMISEPQSLAERNCQIVHTEME